MNRFKPCERVVSLTGRPGRVQHPWVWNAIDLPGYCLVLFDGNRMPRWIRADHLLPNPSIASDRVGSESLAVD